MRQTQRAPKSCTECSSRRVKCDRVIPCGSCLKRGQASRCSREVVLVRGVVTLAGSKNRSHRGAEFSRLKNGHLPTTPSNMQISSSSSSPWIFSADYMTNQPLDVTAIVFPNQFISVVYSWDDVILPNRSQSIQLIRHGKLWTSWIHCAIYYREFESAHEDFWDHIESGGTIQQRDPSWLAIYFGLLAAAVLTIDEENTDFKSLPHDDLHYLMLNWYSASIFCLEKGNYMRTSDFKHVQAIGILQMCSNAVGDSVFRNRILTMGVQIANDLEMPFRADRETSLIHAEISRRLWWVFVICEWLLPVSHRPCISGEDFDLVLPLPFEDAELETGKIPTEMQPDTISPWWYHIILCKTAVVHNQFVNSVRKKEANIESLVLKADEGLANIIDSLPAHLQPSGDGLIQDHYFEVQYPWIRWQRLDLTTNLFLYRAKINYECRHNWSQSPPASSARRLLCLESAHSVITHFETANMPIHQRRYMTYTMRLYDAGLIIASEIPRSLDEVESCRLLESVLKCIHLLENSKDFNVVAEKAVQHLSTFVLERNNIRT